MPLRIECPGCKSVLQIDEALAGKQGRCIHCGHRLIVPAAGGAATAPVASRWLSLSEASPEEMVRQLHDRSMSAMLLTFVPSAEGSYHLADISDVDIKCIVTEDVNQERFAQLIGSIPERFARKKKRAAAAPALVDKPYELKGDRLGMSLEEFKQKYAHFTPDGRQDLPVCSDVSYGGIKALHTEAWHRNAGIVHARIDIPAEESSPTVASVKTDLLLYKFIDGKLFCIEALIPTDQFHVVSEALMQKFGPPTRETKQPRVLTWENKLSLIELARGTVHPRVPSTLHLIHTELLATAHSRTPHAAEDI